MSDGVFVLIDLPAPEQEQSRGSDNGDDEFWKDPPPRKTRKTIAEKVQPTDIECLPSKKGRSPRSKKNLDDIDEAKEEPSPRTPKARSSRSKNNLEVTVEGTEYEETKELSPRIPKARTPKSNKNQELITVTESAETKESKTAEISNSSNGNEERPSHTDLMFPPSNDERDSVDATYTEIPQGRQRSRHEGSPSRSPSVETRQPARNSEDNHLLTSFSPPPHRAAATSLPLLETSSSFVAPPAAASKVEQKIEKYPKLKLELSNYPAFRMFLVQPLPPGLLLQCVIRRQKGTGLFNRYPLYELQMDPEMGTLAGKLLMCAKRQTGNKTSNYHISMDRVNFDTNSKSYLGKVRSNFLGNEYTIYDDGVAPVKGAVDRGEKDVRQELGAVQYMPSLVASQPRELQVVLPSPGTKESGLLARFKSDKSNRGVNILQQKKPRWNETTQAYGLNFHGRVKCASVKNFVLINAGNTLLSETMLEEADMEHEAILFGKLNLEEKFSMDIRWPLSPLQGFAVCMSAFDPKLATE